jgi:predicted metallo-beta-lactamase superfamily hydrolase
VYACAARNNVKVMTAAEYLGRAIELLEARRKELYQ